MQRVDDDALARAVEQQRCTDRLVRAVGEFVATGAPLAVVHGDAPFDDTLLHRRCTSAASAAWTRTSASASDSSWTSPSAPSPPGSTTPPPRSRPWTSCTTSSAASRPGPCLRGNGRTRTAAFSLTVPQPDFADYLALAFEEITHWGSESVRIQRRVGIALRDVASRGATGTPVSSHRRHCAPRRLLVVRRGRALSDGHRTSLRRWVREVRATDSRRPPARQGIARPAPEDARPCTNPR